MYIIPLKALVEVKKLQKDVLAPTKAYAADAGLDIYSNEDVFINEGATAIINTGICLKIPYGYYGKIEDRSGLASIGLKTGAGVIDALYDGELKIVLHNINCNIETNFKGSGYQVKKGQRIAQLILQPVVDVKLVEVQDLKLDTNTRGGNGFGSTGH
jgi:dUTP pyrophosphatase